MLKTEQNTPEMSDRIEEAALAHFNVESVAVIFEHGQHWIELENGAQYSVCDASGPGTVDGFDFEEVTPGDDE